MAKINFGILSQSFSIDKDTNTLSVFNQFDQLLAPSVPGIIPELCIVGSFERENSESEIHVVIKSIYPSGKTKELIKARVLFENKKRARFTVRVNGFQISEFGNYKLRIEWEDKNYEIDLEVKENKLPQ